MSTGSKMFTWAYTNLLSWKKIWEFVVDVVAVVAELTGTHSDELTSKKLAALRAYAKTAWFLNLKPEYKYYETNKGNAMIIITFPVIFFIVQTSRPADVGTYKKRCSLNEQRY